MTANAAGEDRARQRARAQEAAKALARGPWGGFIHRGAGLLVISFGLASWALTWVLGARAVVNDLLHRDAGGISGLEVAAFGAWAFGLAFILGVGWSLGMGYRRK